ncbi:amino acid ABC transporter permease [Pedococcus sp. 5OH_020]|uniref:amino acid ABC transporter permease n=1 Tax=Pedococcus sp. 5OH_020 TaxID=2989814 RepID=UPI0022E9A3F1|nr:amino acid ABC transporter permease [Pedococcus sp. 5OH_020]
MSTVTPLSWLWEWPHWVPTLLPGLGVALLLTVISCGIGYPLGFLLALMTEARSKPLKWTALVLVEVGRGIPILVLLFVVYQGLPSVGILFDALPSACIAFVWSAAAYSAEMIRVSIGTVPRGQSDASYALSMSRFDTYRYIVLPQAARISIPPLVSLTITMFHATSLASVITVSELMHIAYQQGAIYFNYMTVFTAAAVIYLVITVPAAIFADRLSKRLGGVTSVRQTAFRRRRTPAPIVTGI